MIKNIPSISSEIDEEKAFIESAESVAIQVNANTSAQICLDCIVR